MRIYGNFEECYNELKRDVAELGTTVKLKTYQNLVIEDNPDFVTKEIIGECFRILPDVSSKDVLNYIKINYDVNWAQWAEEEIKERMSSKKVNPGEAYKKVSPYWNKFFDKNNKQDYTYNERMRKKVKCIIEELKRDQNSRRAVLSIWDRRIDPLNSIKGKRVPCSLCYIFLVREDSVNITYVLRSSDVYSLLPFDVYFTQKLKEYVANKLNLKVGHTTVFINSLHAYKKDIKGVF